MKKEQPQSESERFKTLVASNFFLSAPIKAFYIDVADSLDSKFRNNLIELFSAFKEKQIKALSLLCEKDRDKAKQMFYLTKELRKKLISAKSKVKINDLKH